MLTIIARAMAERNEPGIWDRPEGPPDEFWRAGYLADAKAVQAALRTPTPAMTKAGASVPINLVTPGAEAYRLIYLANIDAMETESAGDG
ncbi:hypothetical protein LCGC14_2933820 [marine sediment metagenome]|uniref:Uncharacterized protein n=1 Tax=marine sediment metagenome TaxID=412755 RepID=A0A0F8Y764_9ZZZZ